MNTVFRYKEDDFGLLADYKESKQYEAIVRMVHDETDVDIPIIWGIGSRESRWGRILKPAGAGGCGDYTKRKPKAGIRAGSLPPDGLGFGRGLMQIDYDSHEFARTGNWRDAESNIRYAIKDVLLVNVRYFKMKVPSVSESLRTTAAIAAYNCGPGTVRKLLELGADVDKFTSHGNYSADVIARGHWFRDGGGFDRR